MDGVDQVLGVPVMEITWVTERLHETPTQRILLSPFLEGIWIPESPQIQRFCWVEFPLWSPFHLSASPLAHQNRNFLVFSRLDCRGTLTSDMYVHNDLICLSFGKVLGVRGEKCHGRKQKLR
ncbi:hypothetical protein CRG98_015478 [Punica granatum]|uniref:Uncharacterized protein n=1 Tax=Punica granatum TaxID=22663 RepID=A0A2I0K6F8_PUNGR|nr:hypothetical protein CRG98_015478 [Punica granatum]